jgi:DNA-binding transcriptional LysR family regulator
MLNRLEMMRIFCAAAEAGSFKEAAIRLAISPQTVTRAVQELEQLQGELLFHRNTRQVQITSFGERLAVQGRACVDQLDAMFEHAGDGNDADGAGLVRLTAPSMVGRMLILPALIELSRSHPHIQFDLRFTDQVADVVSDKIDIGVRIGPLRDNRFVAQRVGKMQFHIVATRGFIATHGIPESIEQLRQLPLSAQVDRDTGRPWPWFFAGGQQLVPPRLRFVCDDGEAELNLVRAGLVYGQIPDFLVDSDIAKGRLVPVMQEFAPDPWDLYVYRPQRGPMPRRLRLVHALLLTILAST